MWRKVGSFTVFDVFAMVFAGVGMAFIGLVLLSEAGRGGFSRGGLLVIALVGAWTAIPIRIARRGVFVRDRPDRIRVRGVLWTWTYPLSAVAWVESRTITLPGGVGPAREAWLGLLDGREVRLPLQGLPAIPPDLRAQTAALNQPVLSSEQFDRAMSMLWALAPARPELVPSLPLDLTDTAAPLPDLGVDRPEGTRAPVRAPARPPEPELESAPPLDFADTAAPPLPDLGVDGPGDTQTPACAPSPGPAAAGSSESAGAVVWDGEGAGPASIVGFLAPGSPGPDGSGSTG